jgi:hypothetical protein
MTYSRSVPLLALAILLAGAGSSFAETGRTWPSAALCSDAAQLGRSLARNPSEARLAGFLDRASAASPGANVHELVFLVMKDALKEMAEDKKYFLAKLEMYDSMGEALSDYLNDLVEASRALGKKAAGGPDGTPVFPNPSTLRAVISKLPADVQASPDVRALVASLKRDEQLFALARRQWAKHSARSDTPPPRHRMMKKPPERVPPR